MIEPKEKIVCPFHVTLTAIGHYRTLFSVNRFINIKKKQLNADMNYHDFNQ